MNANVRLEHQLLAVESEQSVHAMLELVAPPAPAGRERAPLDLVLVIDRSGSMSGPKLETAKRCAAFLAERLGPKDRLGVVTYDDTVRVMAPLAPVHRQAMVAAIAGIYAGGSTNLSGGWLKGMELLQSAPAVAGANEGAPGARPKKVLLLSDGLANVGVTDRGTLVGMSERARGEGIGTTTIGFGEGFDEDLMSGMADAGGGRAYFAAVAEDAPGIIAEEFEGLTSLIAQNLSVEIRPSEKVAVVGVLNEYPANAVAEGIQVQMGDVFAEDRRRLVLELHVPALATLGAFKVADLVVRYVSVGEQVEMHELKVPVMANLVSADEAAAQSADAEVVEGVVILKAAKARDEATKRADEGDFEAAKAVLASAADDLRRRAPGSKRAKELLAEADRLTETTGTMAPAAYDAMARKANVYGSRNLKRRRT